MLREFFKQLEVKHHYGQFDKKKDKLAGIESAYKRDFHGGGGGGFIEVRLDDEK